MRLLVLSLFGLAGVLYSFAAVEVYLEERQARNVETTNDSIGPTANLLHEPPRHPEANLARLRLAFANEEYTDDLEPYLESALVQAPTFYQPPFLLAAFYANRLERPEAIEGGFEAALHRFPSNGRLHLTFAEWLLTPRPTAPYRVYRADASSSRDEAHARAIEHIERAASLEPELSTRALDLLVRFRTPVETWTEVLPDDTRTRMLILHAMDRAPRDRAARRRLLSSYLADAQAGATLRTMAVLARKWGEASIALAASEKWYQLELEAGAGPELTRATLSVVRECLDDRQTDRAYSAMRAALSTMEERGLAEDSAELLVGVGDLYLARRQLAMAQSLFTEAATRFPLHASAYWGLARAHRAAGDDDDAVRELRRVLELDPGNDQARSLLDVMLEQR